MPAGVEHDPEKPAPGAIGGGHRFSEKIMLGKKGPKATRRHLLRLAGIETVEEANRFLRERYIGEFNAKFRVAATQKGTAFRRSSRTDLDWIFTVQSERVVAKDNTVAIAERSWQLDKSRFRNTLAGSTVTIHEHLDGEVSIRWGPHTVGSFDTHGNPVHSLAKKEHGGRTRLACGSKELESPPFPFPPPGASGVPPPPLRYGSRTAPARGRTLTRVPGR